MVVRYDTLGSFDIEAFWSGFDVSQVAVSAFDGGLDGVQDAESADDSAASEAASDDAAVDGSLADAGTDSADASETYHSLSNRGLWLSFDVSTVAASDEAYFGVGFDGRYVYYAPFHDDVPNYAFTGTAFDGRYMYFLPSFKTSILMRYDTQHPFDRVANWSAIDLTSVDPNAQGFGGAVFDGRYLYFVPVAKLGSIVRYDTRADFDSPSSWATHYTGVRGMGAAFDGRYVYFIPSPSGIFTRFDTQGEFADNAAWATFDLSTLNSTAIYFWGGSFDGRYIYFAPGYFTVAARYDTQAPFDAGSSYSMFDMASLSAVTSDGCAGATFDGRYVYFVPWQDGIVSRFDTQAPFLTPDSWEVFDLTAVGSWMSNFGGAAFDGRYVYMAPLNSSAAQFDAKFPPLLPAFGGASFF